MKKIGLKDKVLDESLLRDNPKREGVVARIAGLVDSEDLKTYLIKTFGRDGLFLEEAWPASII